MFMIGEKMKKFLLNATFTTLLLSAGYSQCNESNWPEYYPDMQDCDLSGANLFWADLDGVNLSGADLQSAMLVDVTFEATNLCNLSGSGFDWYGGGECEELSGITDDNGDGYDDVSFDAGYDAGTSSTDNNNDGLVDNFPIISIIDGNAIILMQESLEQYTDSGASCSDQEDGDLSHQVEVSGDIVNMSSPGTYMIFYNL